MATPHNEVRYFQWMEIKSIGRVIAKNNVVTLPNCPLFQFQFDDISATCEPNQTTWSGTKRLGSDYIDLSQAELEEVDNYVAAYDLEEALPSMGYAVNALGYYVGFVPANTPDVKFVFKPPVDNPGQDYVFDFEQNKWVKLKGIVELREEKWESIKSQRNNAEFAGFDTPYGRFDSTPDSQSKIQGVALAAVVAEMNAEPFSVEFTLQNNQTAILSATQCIEVGKALQNHVNDVHQTGRTLRAAIMSAETQQELDAIQWGSQV